MEGAIPAGAYCYSYTGRLVVCNRVKDRDGTLIRLSKYYIKPETKTCDFWKSDGTGGATCTMLNIHSEYGDFDLLWDQIKICDINFDVDNYEKLIDCPVLSISDREKITDSYLPSIVDALLRSTENQFAYDGKVYTLSKHVLKDYNRN